MPHWDFANMDATKVEDDDDPIGWELKVSRLEPPRAAAKEGQE